MAQTGFQLSGNFDDTWPPFAAETRMRDDTWPPYGRSNGLRDDTWPPF